LRRWREERSKEKGEEKKTRMGKMTR